uniref:Peptide deformylase n=1 Tax=Graphocephala atropunctata TaxID=36148 RepID=A0A1B6LUJ2_9HEMI
MELNNISVFLFSLWLILNAEFSSMETRRGNMFDKFSEVFSLSLLPDYVVADMSNLKDTQQSSIRQQSTILSFPLTEQDKIDIKILETKFDNEKNCAGLAAPQIGITKRFIVFKVEKEAGVSQAFPKTVWINPTYKKASEETEMAYEQCFSVNGVTAPVKRYKRIHYTATDVDGNAVQGTAEGFAARVIQHETDHLDGILFIDLVASRKKIITVKELKRRLKKLEENENRKKEQPTL